jgi:hypothetical protein
LLGSRRHKCHHCRAHALHPNLHSVDGAHSCSVHTYSVHCCSVHSGVFNCLAQESEISGVLRGSIWSTANIRIQVCYELIEILHFIDPISGVIGDSLLTVGTALSVLHVGRVCD